MPVIFSHSKFVNFTIQTAVHDYRSLRLLAGVWWPTSQSACGHGPQAD